MKAVPANRFRVRVGGMLFVPFLLVWATGLLAQEKSQYVFGTTVVSTSGLQGQVYFLNKNTQKLPRLKGLKPEGTIYTNTLNIWPQRFDEGFPGISGRFEWFAIDYTGRFWIETRRPVWLQSSLGAADMSVRAMSTRRAKTGRYTLWPAANSK